MRRLFAIVLLLLGLCAQGYSLTPQDGRNSLLFLYDCDLPFEIKNYTFASLFRTIQTINFRKDRRGLSDEVKVMRVIQSKNAPLFFEFDREGRILSTNVWLHRKGASVDTVYYEYEAAGNETTAKVKNGKGELCGVIHYKFGFMTEMQTRLDREISLKHCEVSDSGRVEKIRDRYLRYNLDGTVESFVYADEWKVTCLSYRKYDKYGFLSEKFDRREGGDTIKVRSGYETYPSGILKTRRDTVGAADEEVRLLQYNEAGQLLSCTTYFSDGTRMVGYTCQYDSMGRKTEEVRRNGLETTSKYGYGPSGRLSKRKMTRDRKSEGEWVYDTYGNPLRCKGGDDKEEYQYIYFDE